MSGQFWCPAPTLVGASLRATQKKWGRGTSTKALLVLPTVKGHSGKAQFDVFLPVLKDYDITRKLGAVVGDNSGTNDTLCCEIEDHLLEEDISWDASYWRARCMGHIINLAV